MQLILVMETRPSCNSDYRYLKATIDYFYKPRSFNIQKIYAGNKSELLNQARKIQIEKQKFNGESVVVVCADYDRPDDPLNEQLINYCNENNFELVWMNSNIEHVYLNLPNTRDKERASIDFLRRSQRILPLLDNLADDNPVCKTRSTNLIYILDKYFERM